MRRGEAIAGIDGVLLDGELSWMMEWNEDTGLDLPLLSYMMELARYETE